MAAKYAHVSVPFSPGPAPGTVMWPKKGHGRTYTAKAKPCRNARCPCNSGFKFKNCCLLKFD